MKKWITLFALASLFIILACEPNDPTQPKLNIQPNQLVLNKVVAIGASITSGFQSGGLVEDFQMNSFPYIIARQMGKAEEFEMPLIAAPGIGSTPGLGPLKFENGQILPGDPYTDPLALLKNLNLPRPYDDIAVPGADLNDLLNTADSTGNGNPFFNIVLRNPNFGNTSIVEQAVALQPSLVLFGFPGGNDVLGAALTGTAIVGVTITPQADFDSRLESVLNTLQTKTHAQIVMSNIPDVTTVPYVNILDNFIYKPFDITVAPGVTITVDLPVVFDANFQPVNFDTTGQTQLYIPLLTEEGLATTGSPVKHILLPFLSEYQTNGLGVPDSAALVPLVFDYLVNVVGLDSMTAQLVAPAQAHSLEQGMIDAGLTPSGIPIPGSLTLTEDETNTIQTSLNGFNASIANMAQTKGVPLVDLFSKFNDLVAAGSAGMDGVTALFVFFDPASTIFSLDGFHPSNAGQAFLAREYIRVINAAFGLSIPEPTLTDYTGQYLSGVPGGKKIGTIQPGAIEQAIRLFVPRQVMAQ